MKLTVELYKCHHWWGQDDLVSVLIINGICKTVFLLLRFRFCCLKRKLHPEFSIASDFTHENDSFIRLEMLWIKNLTDYPNVSDVQQMLVLVEVS